MTPTNEPGWRSATFQAAAVAATITVLTAAVIGLVAGRDARTGTPVPDRTPRQAVTLARDDARTELQKRTARQGFRDGRRDGMKHGRKAGSRAGRTDARVAIAERELASAESEAASARSELSGMTAAPPTP